MGSTTPDGPTSDAAPRPDGDDAVYAVLDAAAAAVVTVDAAGVIDYLNEAAVLTFGHAREDLIGRPVEMLVPTGLADRHAAERHAFEAAPRTRTRAHGLQLRGLRKDGTEFPAEINLTPFQAAGGLRVVATVTDISARREDEDRLDALTRAYRSLAEMNEAIVRATDDHELFAQSCRIAVEEAGYLGAWVGTRTAGGQVVRLAGAGAIDAPVDESLVAADQDDDTTSTMFRLGTPQFSSVPTRAEAVRGIAATAALPLRRRGEIVGALTIHARRAEAFDDRVRALLVGAAENISYALDVLDRAATLRDVARQRSLLARRLIDAQDAERARIAADVHDESVQSLAAAVLRLGLLERRVGELVPGSTQVLGPEFDDLHQTLDSVTHGLRELLFELDAGDPDAPFADLVEDAAQHIFEHSAVRWRVGEEPPSPGRSGQPVGLQPSDRRQALRIVKEALINARNHAGASEVVVTVRPGPDGVALDVRDDGRGFDEATATPGHRGLLNMRDRAAVSGGWCRIERADPGTVVRVWLPYDATATVSG